MTGIDFGILILLGTGVLGGTLGAWFFQKIRVPQVVGYIVFGILIGDLGLHVVHQSDIQSLQSFNWFALGIIGFLVGGELKGETFRQYGKQFAAILLGEGLGAFFLVGLPVFGIVLYVTHSMQAALAAGIVFGAIASATDPASTVEVLWEYRSLGVLTTCLIATVALDDALAMTLYGLGTNLAQIITGGNASLLHALWDLCRGLGGSVLFGAVSAGLLILIFARSHQKKERTLAIATGTLLLVIGISDRLDLDVILVTMTMGIVLVNYLPKQSEELMAMIKSFSGPIYVMFFVLVGARLSIDRMPAWLWLIVLVYVAGRSIGKIAGAYLGAKLSGADRSVQRFTGLGLFAQGGVAIGLSIMAGEHLNSIMITPDLSLGDMIISGVTATTMIVQLIGPSLVKYAIRAAGEIGRNVTTEDVIDSLTVKDVMQTGVIPLNEHDLLSEAFEMFSSHPFLVYPVVNSRHNIVGILTLEHLKDVLVDQDCWQWMVVADVLEPVDEKLIGTTPLKDALAMMEKLKVEQIPVVAGADNMKPIGLLDRRDTGKLVEQKLIAKRTTTPENDPCGDKFYTE